MDQQAKHVLMIRLEPTGSELNNTKETVQTQNQSEINRNMKTYQVLKLKQNG